MLGVTLDSKLTFAPYIQRLVRETSNALYALRKVRTYLTRVSSMAVYTAIIRSRLEYCSNVMFCTNCVSIVADIEKCQNRAARVIFGVSPNTASGEFSVTEACIELGLPSLASRRAKRFHKFVSHLLVGKGSPYLLNLLEGCGRSKVTLRNTCSFILPSARSRFGKRRFVYAAIAALKSDSTMLD